MANTYAMKIERMDAVVGPDSHGHQNSVVRVEWQIIASDGQGHSTHWAETTKLQWKEGESWTELADLTESQVVGWVETSLGSRYDLIKSKLDQTLIKESEMPAEEIIDRMPWSPSEDAIS